MEVNMDPMFKQQLDDVFDAFTMLSNGAIVNLMHVQGNTTRWSPAGVELFGLSGEYIPNGSMDWGDYVHPEDRKRYMDVMTPLATGERQTYDLTYRVRTKDGTYGNFRVTGAVLRDADGAPSMIGGVLINEGLTENVDQVTVLPNRNAYLDDFGKLLKEEERVFSLQVGFSGLSKLNQLHGYTYGNRLLQEVAWLIQETVNGRGSVYRVGSASFAMLTNTLSRAETAAIYDMLRYRLQRGVEVNGIRSILTANGGLISSDNADTGAATVLSCLNYAYEESKRHMHGELVDFNGSINYESARSLELINTIRDSMLDECRGFSMEYDAVVDAETERIKGVEAHVIWENEEYGKVASADFLPILEHDFVFEELSDFTLRQSMTDGLRLMEKEPGMLLYLNVYRIQLDSDYFIENLQYFLKETGFPAYQLCLKFTDECRFIEINRMKEIIEKLHKLKIKVVIAGFGSGVNSVGFLKSENVDGVCLGSQFVEGIEENERDRDILEYLTRLAATCVKHINVKGVDTGTVRELLRAFPVTTMQGGCFSEQLPLEKLMEKHYA